MEFHLFEHKPHVLAHSKNPGVDVVGSIASHDYPTIIPLYHHKILSQKQISTDWWRQLSPPLKKKKHQSLKIEDEHPISILWFLRRLITNLIMCCHPFLRWCPNQKLPSGKLRYHVWWVNQALFDVFCVYQRATPPTPNPVHYYSSYHIIPQS